MESLSDESHRTHEFAFSVAACGGFLLDRTKKPAASGDAKQKKRPKTCAASDRFFES
jgi:hypothetical protein